MALKRIDNLALTQKMPLAFANMAFGLREVGYKEGPVHASMGSAWWRKAGARRIAANIVKLPELLQQDLTAILLGYRITDAALSGVPPSWKSTN